MLGFSFKQQECIGSGFEFSAQQKSYIESDIDSHIYLEACPGSGKTEVVAAKVAREASNWGKFPGGMAVLSFANSATDELKKRTAKYLPAGRSLYPHFLGTFDSFIYKNIVSPLANQLIEYKGGSSDCSIRIIEPASSLGYRTKYNFVGRGSVYAHHYSRDIKNNGFIFSTGDNVYDRMLNAGALEEWQMQDLLAAKSRMLSAGYATYKDIEGLALEALSDSKFENYVNQLALRYPLIIVDECQDLSFEQLQILSELVDKGVRLHLIGDLHQAIYGFRDVDPAAVKQFTIEYSFTNLELTSNFRSCQKIINLCGKLTGRDNIEGQSSQLEPGCFVAQYDRCPTELSGVFDELCSNYRNTTIVARGHPTLQKFHTSATKLKPVHKLALAIKLFNRDDMEAIEKSLILYSEFIRSYLRESVKPNSFNCPQCITSNLSWRRFLFISLSWLSSYELGDMEVDWSSWVRQAKAAIRTLSDQEFITDEVINVIEPLKSINFIAPKGQAKESVDSYLGDVMNSGVSHRKMTIHAIKGETHEATILISTPSASGSPDSHWSTWLRNPQSEAARYAYVASSRPRYRLIWAVKRLKAADVTLFKELGFHIL